MSTPEPLSTGANEPLVNEQTFYRMADVLRAAGISRNALVHWFKSGRVPEPALRDRNGWRLFTRQELETVKREANRVQFYVPPG